MIATKDIAANFAMKMAAHAILTHASHENISLLFDDWTDERIFDEVLHYKFSGEALFIHLKGKLADAPEISWPDLPAEARLFFTLYTTLVPILNSWITPPAPEIEEPKPALPGRGFESINEDSSNRGTIYEREDWAKPQAGQASAAAQEGAADHLQDPLANTPSSSPANSPTAAGDGQSNGHQGDGTAQGGMGRLRPGADATAQQTTDRAISGAGEPGDVTANTDPEPLVVYEGQGEGGDVVDDDDDTEGAEGGSVEGDANTPAVTDQQPKRRKR